MIVWFAGGDECERERDRERLRGCGEREERFCEFCKGFKS